MKTKHVPLRMCIACRQMRTKDALIKVVRDTGGKVMIDSSLKQPGRGAYICRDADCIGKTIKKHLLNKSFSAKIDNEVYIGLEQQLK